MTAPKVYEAITAVMAHMAKEGISKGRKNEQQGYAFRGIDDVFNALSSVLAECKLVMLPFVQAIQREERQTQRGGMLNYTILTVDFKLVSSEDGSSDIIRTVGEAMDSADKSANKAMSAALKYAALQVFMIPTEGDNDADATTHVVAPKKFDVQPEGLDWWKCEGPGPSAAQAKRDGLGDIFDDLSGQIRALTSGDEWRKFGADHSPSIAKMPRGWRIQLRNDYEDQARELGVDLNAKR